MHQPLECLFQPKYILVNLDNRLFLLLKMRYVGSKYTTNHVTYFWTQITDPECYLRKVWRLHYSTKHRLYISVHNTQFLYEIRWHIFGIRWSHRYIYIMGHAFEPYYVQVQKRIEIDHICIDSPCIMPFIPWRHSIYTWRILYTALVFREERQRLFVEWRSIYQMLSGCATSKSRKETRPCSWSLRRLYCRRILNSAAYLHDCSTNGYSQFMPRANQGTRSHPLLYKPSCIGESSSTPLALPHQTSTRSEPLYFPPP